MIAPRSQASPSRLSSFVPNTGGIDELRRRQVRARVDENGMEPGVIVVLAIEQKNAGLRRDRHPDLVGDLQASTPFKLLLRQENAKSFRSSVC
jgi:hypothetical protein